MNTIKYILSRKIFLQLLYILIGLFLVILVNGCTQIVVKEYQAIAVTTYTWRVEYFISRNEKQPRNEEFASTSLTNTNGIRPSEAFGDKDERGLWWPKIPPKPTLEQIEELAKVGEKHSRPEILRTVEYFLEYQYQGNIVTLPTNYQVYRQAVKAFAKEQSLLLNLGIGDRWIEKAEPL